MAPYNLTHLIWRMLTMRITREKDKSSFKEFLGWPSVLVVITPLWTTLASTQIYLLCISCHRRPGCNPRIRHQWIPLCRRWLHYRHRWIPLRYRWIHHPYPWIQNRHRWVVLVRQRSWLHWQESWARDRRWQNRYLVVRLVHSVTFDFFLVVWLLRKLRSFKRIKTCSLISNVSTDETKVEEDDGECYKSEGCRDPSLREHVARILQWHVARIL